MQNDISGAPVPENLLYAKEVNEAAVASNFSPSLLYAVAFRETIRGEIAGFWNASKVVSSDGGYGLCQITWPPVPENWDDPLANCHDAIIRFLIPAMNLWQDHFQGPTLVKLIAATYNEGESRALYYHAMGDVDAGTTDRYGADVLNTYNRLTMYGGKVTLV